jgi:hypothetical protein
VLGADPVMGADEPGFDVAEEGMDDREELAGIGAVVLDHRGVLQVLAEGGVAAAIAGEPVGQQMRPGRDISGQKGAEFGARGGRQHGDPGIAGEEAVLMLDGVLVLAGLVLWRRHLFDGGDDRALVGAGRAASRLVGSPRPPMQVSSASRKPAADGPDPRSARGVACAPRSRPSDTPTPVRAAEIWPRRRACRGPSGRRQETTSRDPSASDEIPCPRSPTPADGRCGTHRPAGEPLAAKPAARCSRNTQNPAANETRPSARTAPPSRTAPQTPEAQPSDPPVPHSAYATLATGEVLERRMEM